MEFPSLKCVRLLLALTFALMKAVQKYIRTLINYACIKDDGKSFWKMVWPLLNICAASSTARNGHSVRLGNVTNKFKTTICAFYIACTTTTTTKSNNYKIIFTRELYEKWYFGRIARVFSCWLELRNRTDSV